MFGTQESTKYAGRLWKNKIFIMIWRPATSLKFEEKNSGSKGTIGDMKLGEGEDRTDLVPFEMPDLQSPESLEESDFKLISKRWKQCALSSTWNQRLGGGGHGSTQTCRTNQLRCLHQSTCVVGTLLALLWPGSFANIHQVSGMCEALSHSNPSSNVPTHLELSSPHSTAHEELCLQQVDGFHLFFVKSSTTDLIQKKSKQSSPN